MNQGDKLASGAKTASFTAADKRMTKEQWAAMFEPDPSDSVPTNEEEEQEEISAT
jgi:hypothetical protein